MSDRQKYRSRSDVTLTHFVKKLSCVVSTICKMLQNIAALLYVVKLHRNGHPKKKTMSSASIEDIVAVVENPMFIFFRLNSILY